MSRTFILVASKPNFIPVHFNRNPAQLPHIMIWGNWVPISLLMSTVMKNVSVSQQLKTQAFPDGDNFQRIFSEKKKLKVELGVKWLYIYFFATLGGWIYFLKLFPSNFPLGENRKNLLKQSRRRIINMTSGTCSVRYSGVVLFPFGRYNHTLFSDRAIADGHMKTRLSNSRIYIFVTKKGFRKMLSWLSYITSVTLYTITNSVKRKGR